MKRILRTPVSLFCLVLFASLLNTVKAQTCDSTFSVILRSAVNDPMYTSSVIANGYATASPYGDTSKSILQAFTWTDNSHSNPHYNGRTLIKFDLSGLSAPPAGAILTSAKIYFYAKTDAPDGVAGQPTYGSANTGLLQRVTDAWDISATNYNNTPATSTADQKILPQSTSGAQDYVVDIKSFITFWLANPDKNYGMLLKMQTEDNPYNSLIFENAAGPTAKRPKIVLTYTVPQPGSDQAVITGDFSNKFQLSRIDNYYITSDSSQATGIQAYTWTNDSHGVPLYIGRSLFKYDLSTIPANSTILSAKMYFYADLNAGDGVAGQPTYGGNNAGLLQKITTPWSVTTVTFNSQPAVTESHQKVLPQSISTAQNYIVNVTDFVQDWVNVPDSNYGVLLRMQQETNPYNSLLFTSSNTANILKPKLVICYKTLLPVVLSNFQGSITNLTARLNWVTENELNFSHTSVEKSYDGLAFDAIGTVAAKGPNSVNEYSFTDANLAAHSNKVYYRLKLVDNDGKSSYSKVLMLTYQYNKGDVKVFPNPTRSFTQINLASEKDEKTSLRVVNMLGKTVIAQPAHLSKGANEIIINGLDKLAKGVYIVQVVVNGNTVNRKIVVE